MPGLEKNRIYRAHIDGYSSQGLGIARIDGQVVFVHGAVRGETCDVLVMKVLKNVAFGKPDATREEIIRACDEAYCDHFIRTLPQGYDTVIGSDTSSISSGQKQLLTIARAVLANAPILILDEATSSVDTRTEQLIQEAMDHLMRGRTSFVIAHRLSTIRNADCILVMRGGSIVEQGTHAELLARGGVYAALYNSQFEDVVA